MLLKSTRLRNLWERESLSEDVLATLQLLWELGANSTEGTLREDSQMRATWFSNGSPTVTGKGKRSGLRTT